MTKMIRTLVASLAVSGLIVGVKPACAQAGSLDPQFGNGGVTMVPVGSGVGLVDGMILQSDGKILVLVEAVTTNAVVRLTSTGALDTSFGSNGIVTLSPGLGGGMMQQPNGQIVIGGVVTPSNSGAELGVERLNTNGTLDTTFGNGGLATASLGTRAPGGEPVVLLQPNGDILIGVLLFPAGRRQPSQTMLARFNSSGVLDKTFGNQGVSIATGAEGCTGLALLSTGEIQVVASENIAQYTANGSLESTVTGGTVVASSGSSINGAPTAFQANGDYLFAGMVFTGEESRGHEAAAQVLRFTDTGAADAGFADTTFHFSGPGGPDIEAIPNSMAVQSNGDIVVVGQQTTFGTNPVTVNGLARLTPSGSLDPTFGSGGTEVNSIPTGTNGLAAVAIQPNGKIVTAGVANSELVVSQYLGQ